MLMLPDYRVRQRDYLLTISRAMTSHLDLDEVLRLVLGASLAMLGGEVGLIALREPEGSFKAQAMIGVDTEKAAVFRPLLEDIELDAAAGGIRMADLDLKLKRVARQIDVRLRQVIALPMLIRTEIVGVVFVFRTYVGEYTPNDQQILQSFADQAAIAVHNAQLYREIDDQRQRLAAVLEHSADGVLIMDADQRVVGCNQALGRMAGRLPADMIGEMHDAVMTWDRIDEGKALGAAVASGWPAHIADVKAGDFTLYVEGDLRRPDGVRISLGVTYTPLFGEGGEGTPRPLHNIIANVRDVSQYRRAQESKSAFISAVSHELKTPVALIKGYASTLRRDDADWDSETIQRALAVIEDEADRLTELINNLLAASKLQAEGMRLQMGEVDLAELATRTLERFQTQTEKHTLQADFPPGFPTIRGDEIRLRQVLDNLISNALKYSPDGGAVFVSGAVEGEGVAISVKDEGIGIADVDQPHLFDRFYRVDDALSRRTPGTGLGLYLSQAFVKAHGGHIRVASTPGKGSTFTFWLPR